MEINIIPPPPITNNKNWTSPQSHYSLYHDLGNNNNNVEVISLYYDDTVNQITKHYFLLSNILEGIEINWKGNPFKLK